MEQNRRPRNKLAKLCPLFFVIVFLANKAEAWIRKKTKYSAKVSVKTGYPFS